MTVPTNGALAKGAPAQPTLPYADPALTGPYSDVKPVAKAAVAPAPQRAVMRLPTGRFTRDPGAPFIPVEEVSGLLSSIRSEGQLVPGLCAPDGEFWRILAGSHRHRACEILGLDFLFLSVEGDTSEARLVKIGLTDNFMRRRLSLIEIAEQIERYGELTGVREQAALAKALDMGPPEVSRALSLPKRLAPSLHDQVRNFEIGRTFAEIIAELPTHELQEKAAKHYLSFPKKDRPKREVFKNYVTALDPGAKKRKPTQKKIGFVCCGVKGEICGTPAEAIKAVKALHVKLTEVFKTEAFKQMEKEPEVGAVLLPSLLKG